MPRHLVLLAIVVLSTAASGCKVYDPLYCDADRRCDDPERPFCDLEGAFPASEGVGRTCIPQPPGPPTGDFIIAPVDDEVEVHVDGELALEVQVMRADGFAGEVTVRADNLPAGTSAEPITISGDGDRGALLIEGGSAEPGAAAEIVIVGSSGEVERASAVQLLVLGRPGALDLSFGVLGVAAEPLPVTDDARFLAQLADGTLMVGGNPAVNSGFTAAALRFLRDGRIDPTFGTDGAIRLNLAGIDPQSPLRFALQPPEKIVLASGASPTDFALSRIDRDGHLDSEFAGGGTVIHPTLEGVSVTALVVGPHQEIVVGLTEGAARDRIALVRFSADGVHDTGFAGGLFRLDRGSLHSLRDLEVYPDGSIMGVAAARDADGVETSFVFRVSAQGALDPDFGVGGIVAFDPSVALVAIVIGPDGRILVGGRLESNPALWRLTPDDGRLDESFGDGGELRVDLPGDRFGGVAELLLSGEGSVLALGSPGITMIRLDPATGTLDASFGEGGVSVIDLNPAVVAKSAVDVGRGRLVIVADEDSYPFVLARVFD